MSAGGAPGVASAPGADFKPFLRGRGKRPAREGGPANGRLVTFLQKMQQFKLGANASTFASKRRE